ncbi:hypothetical protein E5D57_009017 [Metarhizium anisopliae]|nr:hypothetical protein E5D57_009017 [Metarhizium anisopliae]
MKHTEIEKKGGARVPKNYHPFSTVHAYSPRIASAPSGSGGVASLSVTSSKRPGIIVMDITRGSRRARHVAANANASANAHAVVAASEEDVDDGRRQEQRPRPRDFAARAITTPGTTTVAHAAQTPDLQYEPNPGSRRRAEAPPPVVRRQQATPSYSHRTPEQLGGQRSQGGLQTGLAGPAPHPFRLHRSEFVFSSSF